ncbi:MAG: hypothetical protein GX428_05930 [Candidatus Atribacteria bacterium]|nr:hypothetical protein [Candidatus Atribacteria bacterium]
MKNWFFFIFFFFIILLLNTTVFAQDEISLLISESDNYPPEDQEYLLNRVGELVNELQQKGLEVGTLVLKLKEGLHKKVRPYNIVKSLEKKKDSLLEAQKILEEINLTGIHDEETLNYIASSIEHSVPIDLVKSALQQKVAQDDKSAKKIVESLATLIEMGVQPQQAGLIINQFANKSNQSKDLNSLTKIIEYARMEGIDPQRIASKIEEALSKTNNITMVELEVQGFIADIKQKPTIKSGQGVVISSPGITSSGVPGSEGGTSLSPSSETPASGPNIPSQEGGSPLE